MNKVKGVVLQAHIITIFRSQKLIDLQYLGTAALLPKQAGVLQSLKED